MQIFYENGTDMLTGNETEIQLGLEGFNYNDLHRPERLKDLADLFYQEVKRQDADLYARLMKYIESAGEGYAQKEESDILLASAPILSRFIARLFQIEPEVDLLRDQILEHDPVFTFKQFVAKRALKKVNQDAARAADFRTLHDLLERVRHEIFPETLKFDDELGISTMTTKLLEWEKQLEKGAGLSDEVVPQLQALSQERRSELSAYSAGTSDKPELDLVKTVLKMIENWAAVHAVVPEAKERVFDWVSFKFPHNLDYPNLVKLERPRKEIPELMRGLDHDLRRRDGFGLTDPRATQRGVLDEVNYCLYCHERGKDSCSKSLRNTDGTVKKNPLGIPLAGCPLDEKISEMHMMQKVGDSIASLALVIIDNPMCPGTGHRICNDCMKSCIFQKQEPVNIPQAETGVLSDVLSLPYGFEIYSLLTRWNPINARRPYALPYNGKNIVVVGLGPAGYTLSHYLLNEGFGVVGIDGLKIEPLDPALTGELGMRPVRSIDEIKTELDKRVLAGFGGVSEYGITVRWDKNFLTMIHLTLARRDRFKYYGGVRFGGTLTIEDIWDLGFDHIAIASGAGRPTIINLKNNLIRGIRKASDFLMALQLTGAFKRNAMANLQVRLPAIVIGGGLTAIDTATEIFAYYPVQVEKMLERHEELSTLLGEETVWKMFDQEERGIFETFLEHGRAIREERKRAEAAGERPNFVPLVREWGGVSIAYRKRLQDAPAYRLNHEEVAKALEEGINFVENMNPVAATPDSFGALESLTFERMLFDSETGKWSNSGQMVTFPARTLCVAAGTSPNTIYEKEYPGTFVLDSRREFFAPHKVVKNEDGSKQLVAAERGEKAFLTSYQRDGKFISYYGDNHPVYAGNVVKAMASAKHGYSHVTELFADQIANLNPEKQSERDEKFKGLVRKLDESLTARVVRVDRLTSTIVEVIVHAPMQAKRFRPGQFYRLQNYESLARRANGVPLLMEGIALTGAWVDVEKGLLSLIVLEMGGSSRLCATLQPGEQVVVMGPTGTPTEIPENETVLLAGGGLGNAVLFSIAKALKENGNKVIYFAGYKNGADVFKREEIEEATDQVIWSSDTGPEIQSNRAQDVHFRGNIVQAMVNYAKGELGERLFDLKDVSRIIAIGSDRMMAAVKQARYGVLAPYLKQDHVGIGSINSPMQCMMKEVCAQCLQRHVDPVTGEETGFVFSCFNQDQLLDTVDFKNLNDRLRANSIQEKLTNLWMDNLFKSQVQI
jgi:NAD(P)H-flavin reductase/NADPH-dependent glutamate synthase beta subunit-like oxidoreductase